MTYIPFDEVKRLANILQVADWLRLPLRNNRCQCPRNEGDKREIAITPHRDLYHCFGCEVGGDQISLAAHVLGIDQKEAALAIQKHFHGYVPKAVERKLPKGGLDYLEPEHQLVQALNIAPEIAAAIGIGYAGRGTLAGRVLFPLRDERGRLYGYVGFRADREPYLKVGRLEAPS